MKRADKNGKWMVNTSQFRMHDPMSDTYFEPGQLTQATDTPWRQANKAVVKLTDMDGVFVEDPDAEAPTETKAEAAVEAIADAVSDPKGAAPAKAK